ncbi:MAG TPA: aldolase [Terracidiphilus sp.]|jgi:hypothetical protein
MLTIQEIQDACAGSRPVHLGDPVLARFPMHLKQTFYPLGFPVQIETNSEEVLSCAAASWQGFVKLFDTEPIRIRVGVRSGRDSECPPAPDCRVQHHLVSSIADLENFAITDLTRGFSSIWLTEAAVAHRNYVRYFFLEAAALISISTSHATPIHAACIERNGCGVLLCGDSGAGKTSLAYACARAGWSYVTDDASYLINNRTDRLVVGKCNQARFRPSAVELFSELDGRNIIQNAQHGKPSIELSIQPCSTISASSTSRVNYVVFLNRRNIRRQELVRFPTEVARYFMLQGLFSTPEILKVQSSMIDHLLDNGALELRYNQLDWAIERLSLLAERGS